MNSIKKLLLVIFVCCHTAGLQAGDFKTIYDRMFIEYLYNPSPTSVEEVLSNMSDNGSFSRIDYTVKDGSPRTHIQWLISLAAAYNTPENKYYRSQEVQRKYLSGLKFWVNTNYQASNWWFRYIAYPKELSKSVILMSDEIKKDKELFTATVKYLRWSYETADEHHMTGANGCDIIMGSLAASILTENHEQMMVFKNQMTSLIAIQNTEGISPDYMYGQHCGTGRQLYITSYGKEYINSALYYIEFTNKTQYSSPGVSLIEDFYINGIQWVFYSKNYDPNQSGRFNNSDKFYGQFESMTNRILKLNTDKKAEIKKVYNRIKGENSLSGNRMFWRFDYMINRRPTYMVSTRMSSTRTVGAEAGNGDGEYNYYSGNGTNYIFVTGKEYGGEYFKHFNYRQFPGITAEQDKTTLPVNDWGAGGLNGNEFAGGVSDSTYGACAMILDKRGVKAHKAWFYFDNEYVCLGSGITQSDGNAEVFTTLNQCNTDGITQYSTHGKIATLKEKKTITNPDWILHGKIGYYNLDTTSSIEISCDTSLFCANINHGINPQSKTYAYLIKPGIQSGSEASKYQNPVKILTNTVQMQAVKHISLNLVEVIFYQPGTLKMENGDIITVDSPCAVLWNLNKKVIHIANPQCESKNINSIQLNITQNNLKSTYTATLPTGDFAGKSISLKLK